MNEMKVLVFDNYDSFTYNLVHLVEKIMDARVTVHRNDEIALEQVKQFLLGGPAMRYKRRTCTMRSVGLRPVQSIKSREAIKRV